MTTPGSASRRLARRSRVRRCKNLSTAFALSATFAMMPLVALTPALLLLVLPIGLLWLLGVVVPGAKLTIRFYRYVLGLPIPGGARRMWTQTAGFCGVLGAMLLYACAGAHAGLLALPAIMMCVMAGAALVARDRDRFAM